ncbi:hypothetical protein ABFS83_11G022500 [Erythranthe nasuta]
MCDFVDMSSSSSSSSSEPAPFGPADVDKPWVGFGTGCNGLRSVYLRQPGGYSAEIYVYGGQVMSWKKGAEELLYLSRKAVFRHPFPIRGGIPICFPRFFNDENMEHHGFARVRLWSIDASPNAATSPDRASTDLILMPSKTDRPNKFDYRIRIILESNGDLTMISRIQNRKGSGKLLTFHFSYHTYFSVSDISEVRIEGLENVDYLDYLQNKNRFTEKDEAITFDSEVDKVYLSTPHMISIIDRQINRTFTIHKDGALPDIVVWNPWRTKAKEIFDLGNKEYRNFVCVEAAAVENAITLDPGEVWTGTQRLSVHHWTDSDVLPDPGNIL